jgi:phage terminase large subunit
VREFAADHVGIGAGIEGDCAQLNAERAERDVPPLRVTAFKGSQGVLFPERPAVPGSSYKAKDYYLNRKSQAYGWLAYRAALTHRAVNGDMPKNADDLLFLNSKMPELNQLLAELSQITSDTTTSGKMRIDKYGEGSSPNRADALAIATAPRVMPMKISADVLAAVSVPAQRWPLGARRY